MITKAHSLFFVLIILVQNVQYYQVDEDDVEDAQLSPCVQKEDLKITLFYLLMFLWLTCNFLGNSRLINSKETY